MYFLIQFPDNVIDIKRIGKGLGIKLLGGQHSCFPLVTQWNMSQEHTNVTVDCLPQSPLPSSDILPEEDVEVVALILGIPVTVIQKKFQAACLARPIQQNLRDFFHEDMA